MPKALFKKRRFTNDLKEQTTAAVLFTDMVRYSQKTAELSPLEIRNFVVDYYTKLKRLTLSGSDGPCEFETFAGDASVAIFSPRTRHSTSPKEVLALEAALRIAKAVENKKLPATRVGIFEGNIIRARFAGQMLKFGNTFAAANRLEELCGYFGTHILFGRQIARVQKRYQKYIVNIGKITPKNFVHPIHVFSIYLPGIHHWPADGDPEKLAEFIEMKNRSMLLFTGHRQEGISVDFPRARNQLEKAADYFKSMTGHADLATIRILDYIRDNPYPPNAFAYHGMQIEENRWDTLGVRLLRISLGLFKSMNKEFYATLVLNTEWERYFKLQWHKQGEAIVKKGDIPDGVYYIERGSVVVKAATDNIITTLNEGEVFGEMAYFTKSGIRTATVVAATDVVVYKISSKDFTVLPVIRKIFRRIAQNRMIQAGHPDENFSD